MIEVKVFGSDSRWGASRPRKLDETPRVVMFGTEFRFRSEPGFPGSDVTAPDGDQGYLECAVGVHAGRETYIDSSDVIVFSDVAEPSGLRGAK
jgi:hypothetical protein